MHDPTGKNLQTREKFFHTNTCMCMSVVITRVIWRTLHWEQGKLKKTHLF